MHPGFATVYATGRRRLAVADGSNTRIGFSTSHIRKYVLCRCLETGLWGRKTRDFLPVSRPRCEDTILEAI